MFRLIPSYLTGIFPLIPDEGSRLHRNYTNRKEQMFNLILVLHFHIHLNNFLFTAGNSTLLFI